jgi:hypothetical protein
MSQVGIALGMSGPRRKPRRIAKSRARIVGYGSSGSLKRGRGKMPGMTPEQHSELQRLKREYFAWWLLAEPEQQEDGAVRVVLGKRAFIIDRWGQSVLEGRLAGGIP